MQELIQGSTLQGGKYIIERVLGQGGFGITYEGLQVGLNRKVAIKEFFFFFYCERDGQTSHVTSGTTTIREIVERFREKFIKEAQMIASFDRAPHIVPIYDIFEENGTAYYVMRFIEGGSLSSLVKEHGALPVARAVSLISQIGQALSYLHSHQTMHLDVKPANILLDHDADGNEQAVLIDFGISKHYTHQGQATTTSPIAHSKGFAPLEQYREGGVQEFSPTSDVYSLGATLYYLLTAQIPPEATLLIEDPLERPAKISSDLWQVVSRAMESSRKRRYQTVDEMLNALRNVRMTFSSKVNHSLGQVEEETVISSDIGETTVFQKQENKPLKTIGPKNVLQIRTNEQDANLKEEKETTFKGLLWGIIFICAFLVFIFLIFSRKYTNTEQPTFKPEVQHKPVDRLVLAEDNRDSIISALINNMVEVTGGSYMMGETPEQGKTEQSEEWMRDKAHKESVSTFFINKFEVTQEEWKSVMGNNPSQYKGARYPVNKVSWNECQIFINRLNQLTGRQFRLPTEAEWEYAARGGKHPHGMRYAGSNNIDDVSWNRENTGNLHVHPVGKKKPNNLGLYDMNGNVSEWCEDVFWFYSLGHEKPSGDLVQISRMIRGGSYSDDYDFDIARRFCYSADLKIAEAGLRLAMSK